MTLLQKAVRSGQGSKEKVHDILLPIMSTVDGTTIKGHDAVKAHFEREKKMIEEHGSSIIFQFVSWFS